MQFFNIFFPVGSICYPYIVSDPVNSDVYE